MNNENSKSEMDDESIIIEVPEMTSEIIDKFSNIGGSAKVFEFTCTKRERNPVNAGWNYLVKPINEYGDLDFKGHTVLINGQERLCHSFEVSEGSIIIFVAETL